MTTVSITKIQLRRGPSSDLPGAGGAPGLDEGELGYTTDSGRLFVGVGSNPTNGMPNAQRSAFPYQNIEVLTENTPLASIFGSAFSDNQTAFIQSVPLTQTVSFQTMQVTNAVTNTAQDFHIDVSNIGACAKLFYFMFDSTGKPMRLGVLDVVWNSGMASAPLCTDTAQAMNSNYASIQWQAALVGSGTQYIVLQYINQSGGTPTIYFRLDRLHPGAAGFSGSANGYAVLGSDGYIPWSELKPEVQNWPLEYVISGKPNAGAHYNRVIPQASTLAVNLTGSAVYAGTLATANAVFTLNKISGGTTTLLGTVTFTSASHSVATIVTTATSFLAGDVLQLVAPTVADATLADVGITVMAQRS